MLWVSVPVSPLLARTIGEYLRRVANSLPDAEDSWTCSFCGTENHSGTHMIATMTSTTLVRPVLVVLSSSPPSAPPPPSAQHRVDLREYLTHTTAWRARLTTDDVLFTTDRISLLQSLLFSLLLRYNFGMAVMGGSKWKRSKCKLPSILTFH